MKTLAAFLLLAMSIVNNACSKHSSPHQKIQPAKVEKPTDSSGTPKVTLTSEARGRLGIESRLFSKDQNGRISIPVSSLIYDTKGTAWVFVEIAPSEFHREQIRVLRTLGNQIQIESMLTDSTPIVTQGAAELNGTESGVGK